MSEHTAEQREYALEMLSLYRTLRIATLMRDGGSDWNGCDLDEVHTILRAISDDLGLLPGDPGAESAVERFIEWRVGVLRAMPYAEYLRSPEWRDVRHFALHRAQNRCQTCNASSRLQVHHRTYEHRGCERLDDVTVLCDGCHKAFHESRKLARAR